MFNVELLSLAENELSDAHDWYETQLEGLGSEFYNEVSRVLNNIEANPYHYPVRYSTDIHAAVVTRFPYLVIYYIDEGNNIIKILSVFHTSRQPRHL